MTRIDRRELRLAALVAAATAGMVVTTLTVPDAPTGSARIAVVVILIAQGLALARAQRAVVPCAAVAVGLGVVLQVLHPPAGGGLAVAGLFAAAVLTVPRTSLWFLAVQVAASPLVLISGSILLALLAAASAIAAWSLGELVRVRRERRADAVRAVAEQERSVLAREVHDVVGHSLALIIIQAGAADDVFDRDPERTREAVRAIDNAARAALAEVRGVIAGAGRRHDLFDLEPLAQAMRDTGLAVDLRIDGDPEAVPAGVAASTYRIVQEALTNTLHHARARTATVEVGCDPDQVRITVCDDGAPPGRRGPRERPGGNGIAGMRARAELHGGSCETTRLPGGGFRVRARLPVGAR